MVQGLIELAQVVLARLSPVFPFAMVGYALGATSLDVFTFTWATAVGLFPGCFLYAWIGSSAKAAALEGGDNLASYFSMVGGIVATVFITFQAKRIYDDAVKSAGTAKKNSK